MVATIATLADGYLALRTIQAPDHIQPNAFRTGYRVSSAAFKKGRDGTISVDLEEALLLDDLPRTALYPGVHRAVALVGHAIGTYRSNAFEVTHQKVEGNEYHGQAAGTHNRNQEQKAARALADACQMIVDIDIAAARGFGAKPLNDDDPNNGL